MEFILNMFSQMPTTTGPLKSSIFWPYANCCIMGIMRTCVRTPSRRELRSVARMILLPFALLEHEIRRAAQTQIASEREPDGSSADSQNRHLHRFAR
jgi:hypothetical protein